MVMAGGRRKQLYFCSKSDVLDCLHVFGVKADNGTVIFVSDVELWVISIKFENRRVDAEVGVGVGLLYDAIVEVDFVNGESDGASILVSVDSEYHVVGEIICDVFESGGGSDDFKEGEIVSVEGEEFLAIRVCTPEFGGSNAIVDAACSSLS